MAKASVSLPVTCKKVTPILSRIARNSLRIRPRRLASKAPKGSSSNTSFGCITKVRAKATRWRCPPEI